MKWKDTGSQDAKDREEVEPYYEDDGYDALGETDQLPSAANPDKPARYRTWGTGIAILAGIIFLIVYIYANVAGPAKSARIQELEARIESMQRQMQKMDAVDEKVTRIWEQAKAFETFKARFDRSEASTSLRMDHLAMSLDALQKKIDGSLKRVEKLEKRPPSRPVAVSKAPAKKVAQPKRHTVVAGDTLYSISRRYNLSVSQLKALNRLRGDAIIHVGQTLVVR